MSSEAPAPLYIVPVLAFVAWHAGFNYKISAQRMNMTCCRPPAAEVAMVRTQMHS